MQKPEDKVIAASDLFLEKITGCYDARSIKERHVYVHLDVYSGLPNPEWQLTDVEKEEFEKRLCSLVSISEEREVTGGLGYRGFGITSSKNESATTIQVFSGVIVVNVKGAGKTHYCDSGRGVEKWLLETGVRHLPPDLVEMIRQEVAKPSSY